MCISNGTTEECTVNGLEGNRALVIRISIYLYPIGGHSFYYYAMSAQITIKAAICIWLI